MLRFLCGYFSSSSFYIFVFWKQTTLYIFNWLEIEDTCPYITSSLLNVSIVNLNNVTCMFLSITGNSKMCHKFVNVQILWKQIETADKIPLTAPFSYVIVQQTKQIKMKTSLHPLNLNMCKP